MEDNSFYHFAELYCGLSESGKAQVRLLMSWFMLKRALREPTIASIRLALMVFFKLSWRDIWPPALLISLAVVASALTYCTLMSLARLP